MRNYRTLCFLVAGLLGLTASAVAFPNYLDELKADPMLKPGFSTGCGSCHVNPGGGGERNNFGKKFEAQNGKFTPMLRAQDPVKFAYPTAKIGETTTVHFSDPAKKKIVIESEGKLAEIDVDARTVDGKAAATP